MDGFLKPPVFRESGASSFMFCLPATDEENSSASNSSPEEVFNRASGQFERRSGGKKRCSKQGAPPAESLFLEDKESQTEPQVNKRSSFIDTFYVPTNSWRTKKVRHNLRYTGKLPFVTLFNGEERYESGDSVCVFVCHTFLQSISCKPNV